MFSPQKSPHTKDINERLYWKLVNEMNYMPIGLLAEDTSLY